MLLQPIKAITLIALSCFLAISLHIHAQVPDSPYNLTLKKDLPITIGAVSLSIGSQQFQRYIKPLTPAQLSSLDRMQINRFDRPTSYNWRLSAKKGSDIVGMGAILLPVTLLAFKPVREDFPEILIMGIQTISITNGITGFTKAAVRRNRPFTYIDATGNSDLADAQLKRDARFSFFSGHTSLSASSTFFLAKVYSDYYPRSRAKPFVWTGAVILPAIVGALRVRSGKHFPTDVITGYVVGAAVGFLTPQLHKNF
ncbi:MAG: phosphatase PAP2 family protein [Bacteroidia bacterium]